MTAPSPAKPPQRQPRSRRTTWRAPLLAAAAVAVLIGGAAVLQLTRGDDTPSAGSPSVVTGSSCEREARLVESALRRSRVSADVDGDGTPDRVATAGDDAAPPRCRAFVGVRTSGGTTYSTALTAPVLPLPGMKPDIIGVPDLGADGTAEIVVDTHRAVDGALAQLFTLTGGGLRRVPVPGAADGDFMVEGGGVTLPQAAGCTADGSLVVSSATSHRQGRSFTVTRRTFPVTGPPLVLGTPQVTTDDVPAADLATRFPEYSDARFAPCGGDLPPGR